MVALVEGGNDFAVHRTYLGAGGRKADVDPAKAMLGPCAGGAVRLAGWIFGWWSVNRFGDKFIHHINSLIHAHLPNHAAK